MPKYLTPDEELIIQGFTPSFEGKVISNRYFIYARLLFDNLPYDKSQRIQYEVRIYKRPEYIYSELPTGYEKDNDPSTYYNGGSRTLKKESDLHIT